MHCGAIKKTVQGLRPHEKACAKRKQHTTQPVLDLQKRSKTKAAPMYCSCMCRTALSDADGALLRYLQHSEMLEVLDGPIVDPQSHVARIRARALRDSATGWVTMKSKKGWVLKAAHRPYMQCKSSMILYDARQCSQEKIGEVMPNEVVEIIEGPHEGVELIVGDPESAKCSVKVRLPCGTVGWLSIPDHNIDGFAPCSNGLVSKYPQLLCLATQP
jgi:hypothetical protein